MPEEGIDGGRAEGGGGEEQKCRNVMNNIKREGKIYKQGIDDKREERKVRKAGSTKTRRCKTAEWEVGGIMGRKTRLIENRKINLCSSEGLNSTVESGSINLVLPQSASRSTAEYLRFEPLVEEPRLVGPA